MSGPYDEDSWDFEDEYDDRDDDPCDHPLECVDYDILTWRAHCSRCGEAWNASNAEMQMEMQFLCDYAESIAEEMTAAPLPAPDETRK